MENEEQLQGFTTAVAPARTTTRREKPVYLISTNSEERSENRVHKYLRRKLKNITNRPGQVMAKETRDASLATAGTGALLIIGGGTSVVAAPVLVPVGLYMVGIGGTAALFANGAKEALHDDDQKHAQKDPEQAIPYGKRIKCGFVDKEGEYHRVKIGMSELIEKARTVGTFNEQGVYTVPVTSQSDQEVEFKFTLTKDGSVKFEKETIDRMRTDFKEQQRYKDERERLELEVDEERPKTITVLLDSNVPQEAYIKLLSKLPSELRTSNPTQQDLQANGIANFRPERQGNDLGSMLVPIERSQEEQAFTIEASVQGVDFASQFNVRVLDYDEETEEVKSFEIENHNNQKVVVGQEELQEFRNGSKSVLEIADDQHTLLQIKLNPSALDKLFKKQLEQNRRQEQSRSISARKGARVSL